MRLFLSLLKHSETHVRRLLNSSRKYEEARTKMHKTWLGELRGRRRIQNKKALVDEKGKKLSQSMSSLHVSAWKVVGHYDAFII